LENEENYSDSMKGKMQKNSSEEETKTRWASQVAGDIMYVTEDGKSGHKYNKKSWSRHGINGGYMLR
jgi:hypothetical protein